VTHFGPHSNCVGDCVTIMKSRTCKSLVKTYTNRSLTPCCFVVKLHCSWHFDIGVREVCGWTSEDIACCFCPVVVFISWCWYAFTSSKWGQISGLCSNLVAMTEGHKWGLVVLGELCKRFLSIYYFTINLKETGFWLQFELEAGHGCGRNWKEDFGCGLNSCDCG
jgi:hypothetical protein